MALPWQDQETDRPAWRRNEKASCGVSRIRWMPPLVGLVDHLGQGRDGEAGQLPGLEAGPQALNRGELRAEAGRRSTTSQDRWVRIQARMAVLRQAVPHQRGLLAAQDAAPLPQDLDQAVGVVAAGRDVEAALGAATSYAVAERGRHRHLLPVERVGQCRWLAARRPGPAHLGVRLSAPSSKKTRQARRRWAFA
jgi:hypothetical protein